MGGGGAPSFAPIKLAEADDVRHPSGSANPVRLCVSPPAGFRLKHFLREDERLSSFLRSNTSLSEEEVQQVLEARVHLDKVTTPPPPCLSPPPFCPLTSLPVLPSRCC